MAWTRVLCICAERTTARDRGDFSYSGVRKGWISTTAPRRRMSDAARYRAFSERSEFPHVDCTGEPFVWECCPWCGGDLPQTEPYRDQSDGGEGRED